MPAPTLRAARTDVSRYSKIASLLDQLRRVVSFSSIPHQVRRVADIVDNILRRAEPADIGLKCARAWLEMSIPGAGRGLV
jgi:hypothetical protein